MHRITVQSILSDPDFTIFTPEGALIALAASALEKSPQEAFAELGLAVLWKKALFSQDIRNQLHVYARPPAESASLGDVREWLVWLERTSLAIETLETCQKQNSLYSDLAKELRAFLQEQQQALQSRNDLWLFLREAQTAEASLQRAIFPWTTIREHAIPPDLSTSDGERALLILETWLFGELDPQTEQALIERLQQKQPSDTFFPLYREILAQHTQAIWIPESDEETRNLREQARTLAQKFALPTVDKHSEEQPCLVSWRLPHLGSDASVEIFATEAGALFRWPDGTKKSVAFRHDFVWEDPLLGSFATAVHPLPSEMIATLTSAQNDISTYRSSRYAPAVLLEAIKLLEHPHILEAAERIKQAILDDKEPSFSDLETLQTAWLLRLDIERAMEDIREDILDISLANLDFLYEKKHLEQALLALNADLAGEEMYNLLAPPQVWWNIPLETSRLPLTKAPTSLETLSSLFPKKQQTAPIPIRSPSDKGMALILQQVAEISAANPKKAKKATQHIPLPKRSKSLAHAKQTNKGQEAHVWKFAEHEDWHVETTYPKGETQQKDIVLFCHLSTDIEKVIFLGVERPFSSDDPIQDIPFPLEELEEQQPSMLAQLILIDREGCVYIGEIQE